MFKARFLIATGLMMIGTAASATIIAQDDFSYADGALNGNGSSADAGWDTGWDTDFSSTGTLEVVGGQVVASLDARHRIGRVLTTPAGTDGSTLFVGFDYDPGTRFNAIEFNNGEVGGTDRTSFLGEENEGLLEFLTGSAGTTEQIDLGSPTGTNRYVVQFNFGAANADTAQVFLNGVSVGTTSTPTDLTFDRINIAAFTQNGDTTGGIDAFDNLVIATTFEEANIPEPGSLALLGLGGLLIARRRRG
ncbi:MAG: PEP-CTERM sorting domain-containing protein [Phycisphaeraceae bacterium]|nr:PEP-CTERM sorting domain-containing protein [Phycisphaeraceae bacterium]